MSLYKHKAECMLQVSGNAVDLAKSRLGVEPAELSEIVVDHEVFQVLLGLLHPRTFLDEKRHENQWNDTIYVILLIHRCLKVFS